MEGGKCVLVSVNLVIEWMTKSCSKNVLLVWEEETEVTEGVGDEGTVDATCGVMRLCQSHSDGNEDEMLDEVVYG